MQPLTDTAAERAVLAGVFRFGSDSYSDVADLVDTTVFTVDANQVIWRCLEHLVKDDPSTIPDVPSVLSAASSLGFAEFFSSADEIKHLRAVTASHVERTNVRRLAAKVKKLAIARSLRDELTKASDRIGDVTGDEALEAILAMAENPVFDFVTGLAVDSRGGLIGEGIEAYVQHLIDNPVSQVGIHSGYPNWDRAIGGGLRRKAVSVVGARLKVGKSQFGINVSKFVSDQGVPVWYGDTELSREDHWTRLLGNLANVDVTEVETGQFGYDPAKVERVRSAAVEMKRFPYHFESIAGRPFQETLGIMRRWVLQKVGMGEDGAAKPCLMVFDYLKLMDSAEISKQVSEYQVLGFMMTALHNFCVRYGVPILLLVQLNRDGIDTEDTDGVSGSDRIGWLCSNLTYLKWQSEDERAEQVGSHARYTHKLIVIVARHGPGTPRGEFIHMKAEYQYGRLTEGPLRSELAGSLGNRNGGFAVEQTGEIQP